MYRHHLTSIITCITLWLSFSLGAVHAEPGRVNWRHLCPEPRRNVASLPIFDTSGTAFVVYSKLAGRETQNTLYAVDAEGKTKWRHPMQANRLGMPLISPAVMSSPETDPETVYVWSGTNVDAVSAADGTLRWQFPLGYPDLVFFAMASDGTLYAVVNDGRSPGICRGVAVGTDGVQRWNYQFEQETVVKTHPVIGRNRAIYILRADTRGGAPELVALTDRGALKWRRPITGNRPSAPVIDRDDNICFTERGTENGKGVVRVKALTPGGTLAWESCLEGRSGHVGGIGPDGTVYVTVKGNKKRENFLYAVDGNRKVKWKADTGDARILTTHIGPSIGADGTLYILKYNSPETGRIYISALDGDGNEKWIFEPENSEVIFPPVLGPEGNLYLGYPNRKLGTTQLISFQSDSGGPCAASAWGGHGHDSRGSFNAATRAAAGPDEIIVRKPDKGSCVLLDEPCVVSWSTADIPGHVSVELSTDGGRTFDTLAARTPNSGTYTFVPSRHQVSADCVVRVSSLKEPGAEYAGELFSITPFVLDTVYVDDAGTGEITVNKAKSDLIELVHRIENRSTRKQAVSLRVVLPPDAGKWEFQKCYIRDTDSGFSGYREFGKWDAKHGKITVTLPQYASKQVGIRLKIAESAKPGKVVVQSELGLPSLLRPDEFTPCCKGELTVKIVQSTRAVIVTNRENLL